LYHFNIYRGRYAILLSIASHAITVCSETGFPKSNNARMIALTNTDANIKGVFYIVPADCTRSGGSD